MAHPDIQFILVPTDLSEQSERAMEYAVELATRLGVEKVHALFVVETRLTAPYLPDFSAARLSGLMEEARQHADKKLAEYRTRFASDRFQFTTETAEGIPHQEIVAAAERHGANLLVIGAHGHGFVSRLVVGSQTERVLRHAPCPVLVVPEARSN